MPFYFRFNNDLEKEIGGETMAKIMPFKTLGRLHVCTREEDETKLCIRYETWIYNDNDDPEFIFKLGNIGFGLKSFTRNLITTYLPEGWVHLKMDKKQEVVIDDKGRKRILIDRVKRTSKILRRFDFVINIAGIGEGEDKKQAMIAYVMDAGSVLSEHPVNDKTFANLLQSANGDQEMLLEQLKQAMAIIIDEKYPDWRNELSYWEE
jgi:hypothetical protein